MFNTKIGKRDHNKAIQKMSIMNGFLDVMVTSDLHQLRIEDICKTIGISKVTFFNYFTSKEQVVEYFIQLWQYDLAYKLDQKELKGTDILYCIFDNVSEHPAGQQIMNALMGFFIKVECYDPALITDYELFLYNEDAFTKGYRKTMLLTLLQKGLKEENLPPQEEIILVNIIMSGFYGISFVQNVGPEGDLKTAFHQFLNYILDRSSNEK